MTGLVETTINYLRVARRLAPRRGGSFAERLGRLDDRLVFVLGSPRSGTTFVAGAIGSVPGFVDLGEVAPLKAAVPELAGLDTQEAARRLGRTLTVCRRMGFVGSVRAVEQTPEMAFLVDAIPLAYPKARIVHMIRDGRDVACSLLEKPWLRPKQTRVDDAGVPYGSHARFWVEAERQAEFESASDARRAAWVWRSYLSAARTASSAHEVRYEELATDPGRVGRALAEYLEAPVQPLTEALARVHASSVGRFRRDLSPDQLADVEAEAGELLESLAYVT